MRWWGWVLIGLAIGILLSLLWRGDPSEEVQRLRDRVAADSVRSLQVDSLLEAKDSTVARVSRETDSLRSVMLGQDSLTDALGEAHAAARQAALRARLALDSARTLSDTLEGLSGALRAETARAEAAEGLAGSLRSQLITSARLLALRDTALAERESQLNAVREDRDRIRDRLTEAMTVIGRLQSGKTGFLPALGKGLETVGIGAATVGACQQGVLTVGCVAGGVVTVVRLAKAAG